MAEGSGRKGVVSVAGDGVLAAVGRCTRRTWLASPFLSRPVAQALADRAPKGSKVDRRLLTALTQRSIEAGVLDPGAIALLRDAGWQVRSIPNLHAKALVCDRQEGLLGSANLTVGGLGGGNLELGRWLAPADVAAVARYLDDWWSRAAPVESRHLKRASRTYRQRRKSRGWVVGEPLEVNDGERLQANERLRSAPTGGLWLKAVYHEGRDAPPDWWVHQQWINDAHGKTPDGNVRYTKSGRPAGRPRYRVGDFVALYLAGPGVVPVIYEVMSTPRFDIDFVKAHWPDDPGRWGWVTDVDLVLRADLNKAPPLSMTGISANSLEGGKKRLTHDQFQLVQRLINDAS
jgi:hypothetical protein